MWRKKEEEGRETKKWEEMIWCWWRSGGAGDTGIERMRQKWYRNMKAKTKGARDQRDKDNVEWASDGRFWEDTVRRDLVLGLANGHHPLCRLIEAIVVIAIGVVVRFCATVGWTIYKVRIFKSQIKKRGNWNTGGSCYITKTVRAR